LILADPPHHHPPPPMFASARRNQCSAAVSNDFCNKKSANSGSVQHARLAGIQRYEGREIGRAVAFE